MLRCLPALAMAPAEILSGKIVSEYVPQGRPSRRGFPRAGKGCGQRGADAIGREPGAAGGCPGEPRPGRGMGLWWPLLWFGRLFEVI